ncbi:MFS general substrate transporter [Lichtheimia hyalospora FSU 10163]|nr:MFS general substrate transporter [Lichtheimia hyalospora FSU 10163]
MPFPSFTTGAVAPVDGKEARDRKKQHRQNSRKPSIRKRPILLNVRSSDYFIFATAAIGLFSSTFVHSILFPLSPFIINRINHGDDAQLVDSNNSTLTPSTISSANVETSRDTGILVALYAVGLLAGSPIFGWLGDKIKQRRIPMLLGISASIAANLMFMFAFAYWMLLLARFLQGVSNAAVWTMSLCLIADNWPENQLGLQMGKLVGFYPLGMMAGLPIGVLYGKLGHQAPFIASMILCGVDFFMRVVIVERCHAPRECDTWSASTLTMQLASEWKFDEATIGLILIAYMLPAIASGAVSGWLCDRYGTKIVALVSLTLVTPACVAIGIPNRNTPFWPLVLLLAVGGMTMAGCQSPIFPEIASVVARENERHKGKKRDGLATSYALFNAAYGAGKLIFTHTHTHAI